MICVDTTFLIDLWRHRHVQDHPTVALLRNAAGETFAVPAHAAGEFLEGAACISQERFQEALVFLAPFNIGTMSLETAKRYASAVSDLRGRSLLQGASKPDLWIAAWALEHGARLATRNRKHFENVPELHLIAY